MMSGLAWVCGLGLLATSATAAAGELVIEVDAGPHERRETPVSVSLPQELKDAGPFTIRSADEPGAAPLVSRRSDASPPELAWILRDRLPAGAKRRYRLTQRVPPPGAALLRFSDPTPALSLRLAAGPILTYHTEAAEPPEGIDPVYRRSGFIHPLSSFSGRAVTDDFPPDHAHQHGLFFAWVNTDFEGRRVDFWNQKGQTGRVQNVGRPATAAGTGLAELVAELRHDDLTAPGGPAAVLKERWRVRVYALATGTVIDLESAQECAGPSPLNVNHYHYGGLGLRGNRQWFDPSAQGNDPPDPARCGRSDFLTSEGKHRADGNHTRPPWVDLSGAVDGRTAGVTILDHPGNFRFPQPVRLHPNKPYFCFAPMVLGGFEITPGRPYVSRYRIYVHDGPPDREVIERLWNDYAEPPEARIVAEGE